MMKQKKNMKKNGCKVDQALAFAEDYLKRAQLPFLVLGKTAKHIMERGEDIYGEIEGDKVELGVLKKHLTKSCFSLLKAVCPKVIHKNNQLQFTHEGVPVNIKVIHRRYKCLENPDTRFYKVTEYRLPNPFKDYWKIKGMIR